MKTISSKLCKRVSLFFLAIMLPFISLADELSEQAKADERNNMYMEIACVVLFVGGVVAFLIWKSKHDKKEREEQIEKMRKIQASKRRAA